MDELPQYTLTSRSLHSDGRAPAVHSDEPFTAHRWTGSYLQFLLTKLFPQLRRTSSNKIILTSSPLNSDGRAPAVHSDEPFTAHRWTGSHLQFLLMKLFPQLKRTSSYKIILTSSPINSDGRAPAIHSDEPFTALRWTSSRSTL